MTFDCRKSAFILLGLYLIIPILYVVEVFPEINPTLLVGMLLGVILAVNVSCNNYKLTINDTELIVYRLIGIETHIPFKHIHKIELRAMQKNMKLMVTTKNKQYLFAINCLDEKQIANYLKTLMQQEGLVIEIDLTVGKNKQAGEINNFS